MRNATFITLFGAAVSTFNLSDEATDSFPLSLVPEVDSLKSTRVKS